MVRLPLPFTFELIAEFASTEVALDEASTILGQSIALRSVPLEGVAERARMIDL